MSKKLYILFLFVSLFKCFGQEIEISHALYHQYQGDFKFDNGLYITGAPMDEIEGSMVFIEPEDGSLGGIFLPESKTNFVSQFPANSKSKLEFDLKENGIVEGLWWFDGNGNKKYASKITSPVVKQIEFKNSDITLAGELVLPQGKGPFPTIINVHGSGKQNRHLGPWTSFFTKFGIAVLSYDKRGVGESTGRFETAGYKDLASDVIAGVNFLKTRPEVNKNKIGIQGSSEGGWVGSIAASQIPDLSIFLVRVGSGESGFETYMHEVKNELKSKNLKYEEWVEAVKLERKYYNLALSDISIDSINSFIRQSGSKYDWFEKAFGNWDHLDPEYRIKMRETGPIDPVESLREIKTPTLWFLAKNDENVPYELSEPRIKLALYEAGNTDFEVVTLPDVKHNFILEGENGEFKYTDGYWDKMAEWLIDHDFTKMQ